MIRSVLLRCSAVLAPLGAALFVAAAAPAPTPVGEWQVADKTVLIRVVECDGAMWGVISWELAKGGTDDSNPNPRKRGRPVLGMPILVDMKPSGTSWNGHIYNSDNGRLYSGGISLKTPDIMRVRGCVFAILCGGEDWTRADATHERDLSGSDDDLCARMDRSEQ